MTRIQYRQKMLNKQLLKLSKERPEGWQKQYRKVTMALYYLVYPEKACE